MTVLVDAVARNPRDATAHFLLGSLHLSSGDTDAAIKSWELAASLRPGLPTLHRSLGYTFLERGELDKAIAVFREGTKHDPGNILVVQVVKAVQAAPGFHVGDRFDIEDKYVHVLVIEFLGRAANGSRGL